MIHGSMRFGSGRRPVGCRMWTAARAPSVVMDVVTARRDRLQGVHARVVHAASRMLRARLSMRVGVIVTVAFEVP